MRLASRSMALKQLDELAHVLGAPAAIDRLCHDAAESRGEVGGARQAGCLQLGGQYRQILGETAQVVDRMLEVARYHAPRKIGHERRKRRGSAGDLEKRRRRDSAVA